MFKRIMFVMGFLLAFVSTVLAQDYYDTVTIKLVNPVTGQPLSCADLQAYGAAEVSLYTPDYYLWYFQSLDLNGDCSKVTLRSVYKGNYLVLFSGQTYSGLGVPMDGIQVVYRNGSPAEYTSTTVSFTSSANTSTKTFYIRPVGMGSLSIYDTTLTTDASGNTIVSVTGSGFGSTKGWIDVGGKITNSSTYILSWSDTQVDFKLPYEEPVYMAICPKYYGCIRVDCVECWNNL